MTAGTLAFQPARAITANGPFDLDQALRFLSGFAPAPLAGSAGEYAQAHVLDGRLRLVRLHQRPDGALEVRVAGEGADVADLDAAERLIRRVFSLDWDGADFYGRIAAADPVLAGVQQRLAGLRPVLLSTPFEALGWAIICQRIQMTQAARLKARLAERYGPALVVYGREWRAFPAPEHLLALDAAGAAAVGLPMGKFEWLRRLAERGFDGDLEPEPLLALGAEAARAWLRQSPGVGPWASEFCLIRGVGYPDLLPVGEQRIVRAVREHYGLAGDPTEAELTRLGEAWRPYRSWAVFLLRTAWQMDEGERRRGRAASGGNDDEP